MDGLRWPDLHELQLSLLYLGKRGWHLHRCVSLQLESYCKFNCRAVSVSCCMDFRPLLGLWWLGHKISLDSPSGETEALCQWENLQCHAEQRSGEAVTDFALSQTLPSTIHLSLFWLPEGRTGQTNSWKENSMNYLSWRLPSLTFSWIHCLSHW